MPDRLPSRFEVYLLHSRGEQLRDRALVRQQMTGLDVWTNDVCALLRAPLPPTEGSDLQDACVRLEEVTQGGDLPTAGGVAAAIAKTLDALEALAKKELEPTDCPDDVYVAFLDGALIEDQREPRTLGRKNSVRRIAHAEEMEPLDVQRGLARAIDRELMRQRELGDEFVLNEEALVEREADRIRARLERDVAPPASPAPKEDRRGDWILGLTPEGVLAEYEDLLRQLEEAQAANPLGISLPARTYHDNVGALEAETRRLMALHAPELTPQWEDARRPASEMDDMLDSHTGDVAVPPVIAQMRQRVPVLRALVRRIPMTPTPTEIPDHLRRYSDALTEFWGDYAFDRSVFIMMKFPDRDSGMPTAHADLLDAMYATVESELSYYGLSARRADHRSFQPELWDNLNVYMLGCRYGVALLEDRVENLLNPNIALEYGFMRALGRRVLLLRERGFKHTRADFIGTLAKPFTITDTNELDEASVRKAIEAWAVDLGLPLKKPRS